MNSLILPIDKVEVPEERVTSYFDQDAYEEFKRTIAKFGVIEPIVCVEVDGRYVLVDGLHRLQEAKDHGVKEISAVVIPGEEEDVFLTNLFLNVMRGKTKVAEIRRVIEILADDYKMTAAKICKRTGLSQGYVIDLVKIGELPEEILQAFDNGLLSKGAALALCKLSPPELQLRVFAEISGRSLSVEDIEGIVNLLREEAHEIEPPTPKEPATRETEVKCDGCYNPTGDKWLTHIKLCTDCQQEWATWWLQRIKVKETPA
jgi:ParB family chromosome partitioning protein